MRKGKLEAEAYGIRTRPQLVVPLDGWVEVELVRGVHLGW